MAKPVLQVYAVLQGLRACKVFRARLERPGRKDHPAPLVLLVQPGHLVPKVQKGLTGLKAQRDRRASAGRLEQQACKDHHPQLKAQKTRLLCSSAACLYKPLRVPQDQLGQTGRKVRHPLLKPQTIRQ